MILDLNNCFPLSEKTGERSPLPKQLEFMQEILNSQGSKYVAYVGGIGSGKTVVGCVTILTLAVLYPGDYLVGRQFYPELRDTTLKTFLEICPKELIQEYRVADGIIKIKSRDGKISNVFFRQMEEPEKMRSLNLNAFYLDEGNQVSEAAFMLLQGRLRGQFVRKGFITSNPAGHDWLYQWFVKQDMFKAQEAKDEFKLIKAPSTENIHLPQGYIESIMQTWSGDRIQREIMASFDAFEGQVYSEFRQDHHIINPFKIPEDWPRIIGADHGYRNPTCWLWGAVDYDGTVFVYREFYQKEWLIEEIVKGHKKLNLPGILGLTPKDERKKIQGIYIDPSIRARKASNGLSDWDTYLEHLPSGLGLIPANNDKTPGIDKVKTYLKLDGKVKKSKLYIFKTCENLIEELVKYRYQELPNNMQGKHNVKEEPYKVNDHACDALRYMIMSLPDKPKEDDAYFKSNKYATLESSLHEEIREWKGKNKKYKDPWGDQ